MRAAGIDLGAVRVGIAVADELGLLAHPRAHLDGRDRLALAHRLRALAAEESLELFVLGLPRQLDGREGLAARRVRSFGALLERVSGLPVELYDEWLTTREASQRLREQGLDAKRARARVDSAAAALILQSWLDGRRGGP